MTPLARYRIVAPVDPPPVGAITRALEPLRAAAPEDTSPPRVTGGRAGSIALVTLAPAPIEAVEAVELAVERVAARTAPFALALGAPLVERRRDGGHALRVALTDAHGPWAALLNALHDAVTTYGFEVVSPAEAPSLVVARVSGFELEALVAALAALNLGELPLGRLDVQVASGDAEARRAFATRRRFSLGGPSGDVAGQDAAADRVALVAELERRLRRRAARLTSTPGAMSAPPASPSANEHPGDLA